MKTNGVRVADFALVITSPVAEIYTPANLLLHQMAAWAGAAHSTLVGANNAAL
jgi:hypothetical protein